MRIAVLSGVYRVPYVTQSTMCHETNMSSTWESLKTRGPSATLFNQSRIKVNALQLGNSKDNVYRLGSVSHDRHTQNFKAGIPSGSFRRILAGHTYTYNQTGRRTGRTQHMHPKPDRSLATREAVRPSLAVSF